MDGRDGGFGDRLRVWRKTQNLTQSTLAAFLGIGQQSVAKAEKGQMFLSAENLCKLHTTYGLNLNWLLVGKGPMLVDEADYGRAPTAIAWDADQVPDDVGLLDDVAERLRSEMWHAKIELDPDQYIVMRFLLGRMAIGLGHPPSPLIIRKLLFIAQGPNPNDGRISGRLMAAESASPYSGASPDKKDGR
jgi:transcriptional regulator with XRE-family HTH domain